MSGAALAIMLASIGQNYGLPDGLLPAVCFVESSYRPHVISKDDGGPHSSIGLCQVQLRTAKSLGYPGDAKGLLDPITNAAYASAYLYQQYLRYGNWDKAVIAYNRGNAKGLTDSAYLRKVKRAMRGH